MTCKTRAHATGSVIDPTGTGSPNLLLQIEASACPCNDHNAATLGACSVDDLLYYLQVRWSHFVMSCCCCCCCCCCSLDIQIHAPPLELACSRRFPAAMGSVALVSPMLSCAADIVHCIVRSRTAHVLQSTRKTQVTQHHDAPNCRLATPSSLFRILPYVVCRADFVSSAGQCILCAPSPSPPPANDLFAGAITITSGQTLSGSTATATREPGEPVIGPRAYATIWYRFSAPASAKVATVRAWGCPSASL